MPSKLPKLKIIHCRRGSNRYRICGNPAQLCFGWTMFRRNLPGEYYMKWKHTTVRFITARCYASAVLAMGLCPCLSVCVCLSQAAVLLKRQNVGSHKQHYTIVQGLWFSDPKYIREIRPGSPPTRAPNTGGVVKIGDFRQITGYISKTVQDKRVVSIKVE